MERRYNETVDDRFLLWYFGEFLGYLRLNNKFWDKRKK